MTTTMQANPPATRSASLPPPRRYKLTDAFFEEAIQGAIRDSLFSPITLGERHDVRLKPAFNTACWAYLPPHQIFVGKDLFEKPAVRLGLTERQKAKYVANHYHHELGHALYTERDMPKIQAALRKISAPFGLFNLFEDATMESRYGREAEYRFDWLELETLEVGTRPESMLFGLIQAEGDATVVAAALEANAGLKASTGELVLATKEVEALAKFPRVLEYYQRIVGTAGTMLLMPVLADWLAEFGKPPKDLPNSPRNPGDPEGGDTGDAGDASSDLALSYKLMTDAAFAQEFSEDCREVIPAAEEGLGNSRVKVEPVINVDAISSKGKVLKHDSPVDMAQAERLAQKFSKLFQSTTRLTVTATPQKRISARNLCLGRPYYKRKELSQKARKNLFLEVDCSGSMTGVHIEEGKLLVMALSLLASRGMVSGHVALSAVVGRNTQWETFKLPMAPEAVRRIQAFASAEGLADTLQDNIKLAQQADYVFVYTDGQICDRPIDKSRFHAQGVYTWGLYAGSDASYLPELVKYFDKAIMRQSAEALVDAMLVQLK